jgi:hypothetical protein
MTSIGRDFFPKILGVLLLFASAGYLSDSFGRLESGSYGDKFGWVVAPPAVVGELSFALWLIFKGAGSARLHDWRSGRLT